MKIALPRADGDGVNPLAVLAAMEETAQKPLDAIPPASGQRPHDPPVP